MRRRWFIVLSVLALLVVGSAMGLWACSYTQGFWVQTSPPGTVWAFKVWGREASVYRLTRARPYPDRRAAVAEFDLGSAASISGATALLAGAIALWPRKKPAGTCPACGYDLRATPERCPECGYARAGHLAFVKKPAKQSKSANRLFR